MGTYAKDTQLNRRDQRLCHSPTLPKVRAARSSSSPCGCSSKPRATRPFPTQSVPHHLLDDADIVYTTEQSPPTPGSLPDLPSPSTVIDLSPRRSTSPESPSGRSKRPGMQRRGQAAGDVGWGCATINKYETECYGRVDGMSSVSADLTKKHQFMKLSGDPGFDKRAGRMVLTAGSLRKPDLSPTKRSPTK